MPTTLEIARRINWQGFLGLPEVKTGFGIDLSPEAYAQVPFCEETLRQCKDSHVLVAGASLTLNGIRKIAWDDFHDTDWFDEQEFANDRKVEPRWYLFRRGPVPKSGNKTYDEQKELLTPEEEVPYACEMAFMAILYRRIYQVRLLPTVYVRCQDKTLCGRRVNVGDFDSSEFVVYYGSEKRRRSNFGLASARKPESCP